MRPDLLGIVPSRERPDAVAAMVSAWTETAARHVELLFVLDDDDPTLPAYRRAVDEAQDAPFPVRSHTRPRQGPVAAANHMAVENADTYPMLAVLPDNHDPAEGWSDLARMAVGLGDDGPWIAHALSRTARPWSGAWFVTSSIVRSVGYLAPPGVSVAGAEAVWSRWGREARRLVNLTPSWADEHPTFTADHDAALWTYYACGRADRDTETIRLLADIEVAA